jgi:hypothetical protein
MPLDFAIVPRRRRSVFLVSYALSNRILTFMAINICSRELARPVVCVVLLCLSIVLCAGAELKVSPEQVAVLKREADQGRAGRVQGEPHAGERRYKDVSAGLSAEQDSGAQRTNSPADEEC